MRCPGTEVEDGLTCEFACDLQLEEVRDLGVGGRGVHVGLGGGSWDEGTVAIEEEYITGCDRGKVTESVRASG